MTDTEITTLAREYADFTDMSPVDKKKHQRDMRMLSEIRAPPLLSCGEKQSYTNLSGKTAHTCESGRVRHIHSNRGGSAKAIDALPLPRNRKGGGGMKKGAGRTLPG